MIHFNVFYNDETTPVINAGAGIFSEEHERRQLVDILHHIVQLKHCKQLKDGGAVY